MHVGRLAILCLPLILAACVGTTPAPHRAFLDGDNRLRPVLHHKGWLAWRSPLLSSGGYTSAELGDVRYDAVSKGRVADRDRLELVEVTREALATQMAKCAARTSAPGGKALRVNATITAVGRPIRALNVATNLGLGLVTGLGGGVPATAGGAAVEIEAIDAISGERLAAFKGRATGMGGPLGGVSRYQQARAAIRQLVRAFCTYAIEAPRTTAESIVDSRSSEVRRGGDLGSKF